MGNFISGIGSMIGSGRMAASAGQAAGILQNQLATTTGYLSPYITAGQNVLDPLTALATGSPTGGGPDYVAMGQQYLPGQMSQAQLEQTPGYQFVRDQGLKAVGSMNAARGLGVSSGAALKGAAGYATGLANATYSDQFAHAQKQFEDIGALGTAQQARITNQANRLQGVANMGATAGNDLGQIGANLATGQAADITAKGAAEGAAIAAPFKGLGADVNSVLGMSSSPATQANPQGGPSIMQNWLSKIV